MALFIMKWYVAALSKHGGSAKTTAYCNYLCSEWLLMLNGFLNCPIFSSPVVKADVWIAYHPTE
jgi:hypothetical protein